MNGQEACIAGKRQSLAKAQNPCVHRHLHNASKDGCCQSAAHQRPKCRQTRDDLVQLRLSWGSARRLGG